MSRSRDKGLAPPKNRLSWIILFAVFGACGAFLGLKYEDSLFQMGAPMLAAWLAALYAAAFAFALLCTLAHELGHFACGRMSGYRFLSFRVMRFMWVRQDGGLRLKRLSLPGTLGQCLMAPPPLEGGKMPVALYNLGGVIANALLAAVFIALAALLDGAAAAFMALFAAYNLYFALLNGIPMRVSGLENDAANLRSLRRNPAAMRALWVELSIEERRARGERLKEMPAQWFAMPDAGEMTDGLSAELGVWACARLIDEGRFAEANAAIVHLLDSPAPILWVNRCELLCERVFCEAVAGNVIEAARIAPQLGAYLRAMRKSSSLSVLRVRYALARLVTPSEIAARDIRAAFDRAVPLHPYAGNIAAEREWMEHIDRCAEARQREREARN